MHPMLNIAQRAARAAGNVIARKIDQGGFSVEEKRKDDLVTDVDRECENTISSMLLKSYRDHAILGEEGGLQGNKDSEYVWVIDPIDGTTNFVKGLPHCAVSIGLQHKGRTIVGVVFDPFRDEGTAFPTRYRERLDAYMELFTRLINQCADVRRSGSASLDLCYAACGRYDAYLEQGLKPWDFTAGELILRESGGIATDFAGGPGFTKSGNIVSGNPQIVQNLLAKVCDAPNLPGILR